MKILDKNYSHKILIDSDESLDEQCCKFIENLEKDYNDFKNKLNQNIKKHEELRIKSESLVRILFEPENIQIKSPMTIINAPWGVGKTFFIENVCDLILSGEIKPTLIGKIIIIDTWKFSCAKEMPDELIFEIFSILMKDSDKKTRIKLFEFIKNVYNISLRPLLNTALCTELEKLNSTNKNTENKLKKHSENSNYLTVIFLDNIERLGKNSWEIIKSIQRLTSLENYIFVMPMNKDKLNDSQSLNGEWSIEKYINMPLYNFEQNYVSILNKNNFNLIDCKMLNKFLNVPIEGNQISIRELKYILQKRDLIESFKINKYRGLREFVLIWNAENEIKKEISEDVVSLWNILIEINNYVDEFFSVIQDNVIVNKIKNLLMNYKNDYRFNNDSLEFINFEVDDINNLDIELRSKFEALNSYQYLYYFNVTEQIIITSFLELLYKINIYIDNLLKEIEILVEKKSNNYTKNCDMADEIEMEIDKINLFIIDYNNDKIVHDAKNNKIFNIKKNELEVQNDALIKIGIEMREYDTEIMFYNDLKIDLNAIINGDDNLNNLIEQIKEKHSYIENKVKEIKDDKDVSYVLEKLVEDKNIFNSNNNANEFYIPYYDIESRIEVIINKIYQYD